MIQGYGGIQVDPNEFQQALGWVNVRDKGAVGDGVHDDTGAINAALAVAQENGCTVYFPPGTFMTQGNHAIMAGQTIIGAGWGLTTIRLLPTANASYVFGLTTAAMNYMLTLRDFAIDGNKGAGAQVADAIYLSSPNDSLVENIRIIDASGNGLTLTGTSSFYGTANKLSKINIRYCGGIGVNLTGALTDTMLSICDVGGNVGHAYNIGGPNTQVVGCIGWGSANGFYVPSDISLVWVTGSRFDTNEYHGLFIQGAHVSIVGCLIYNNSISQTGTYDGVHVEGASSSALAENVTITGCQSLNGLYTGSGYSDQQYGINLAANHANCYVGFNDLSGSNAQVNGATAGDYVMDSWTTVAAPDQGVGYISANASTVTVTPPKAQPDANYIPVISTTWETTVWIGPIYAASFTVNFGTAPTANANFGWEVVR